MGNGAVAHHKRSLVPGQGVRPLPQAARVLKQWVTWSDLGFKRPHLIEDSLEGVSRMQRDPKGCSGPNSGLGWVR